MRKSFRCILAFVLSIAIFASFCAVPMVTNADSAPLKFGSDGKFKIVIFSDVQDQFPVHQRVINIMKQAITRESPDLVVFLGDNTEQNIKDPEVDFRRTLERLLSPVVEANVPYAFVFGNHDDQSYYSGQRTDKEAMLAVYQSIGDCRTVDADPSLYGTGTCKIPIYASGSNNVAFDLFMIDSNAYQDPVDTHSGYGSPHADQMAWVAANKDAGVNSLAFQHIPMPEIYNLLKEGTSGTTRNYGGKTYVKELNENATGSLGEFPNPCPANCNFGEFNTLRDMGGVLGVFTGHDHLNDYTGVYDGLRMTAVPGMTYFNYGDEAVRGYGVIELDESNLSAYDYHTVKFTTLDAEAGGTTETVYDSYDEITYSDLRKNGQPLPATDYNIHGSNTFTYNATSPSYSAIFKFRWTAGADTGIQFSFDEGENGNCAYPFAVWVKKPGQGSAGGNGAWHLKPSDSKLLVNMDSAVKQGDVFDIELGRLKILSGEPQHLGEYYVYLKVNGVLIKETYSSTDDLGQYMSGNALCQTSNKLRFGDWSTDDNNNRISASPFNEEYEDYDEILYSDLLVNGVPVAEQRPGNGTVYTYNKTSASGSAVFKLRYTPAGTATEGQISFDKKGSENAINYMFGVQIYKPTEEYPNGRVWLRPGYGPSVGFDEPLVAGQAYDVEFARLKVKNGPNEGKYYMYFKMNGKLIAEDYVAADVVDGSGNYTSNPGPTACSISNEMYITFWGDGGATITDTPQAETYEQYDEVGYADLRINGNKLPSSGIGLDSTRRCTYDATSESYSSVIKFRWTAGDDPHFVLYYDAWAGSAYPFSLAVKRPNYGDLGAAAGENGAWHIDPSVNSHIVQMSEPIVAGQSYNMEFGRLKVKNGANKGKYYVFLKVDGELISSYYYDGVSSDGTYKDGAGTLSNNVLFTSGTGGTISAFEESSGPVDPNPESPYYDYDEITYNDLLENGNPVPASGYNLTGKKIFSYNRTSDTYSAVFKYRWTAGDPAKFSMSFDTSNTEGTGSESYPFCAVAKYPNQSDYGAVAGPNGAWQIDPSNNSLLVNMESPLVTGNSYDIEFARLKVKNGEEAGKYYVYLKVNGTLIQSYYYAVNADGTYKDTKLSNNIVFTVYNSNGNTISASPYVEEYEDYDEIAYADLMKNGDPVNADETSMSGATVFTYNRTSPTGSAIFKYKWKVGSVAKFQMSFEKTASDAMAYMFGAWLSEPGAEAGFDNGRMWLRPGTGPQINMPSTLTAGSEHNVEFARLKVKTGPNKGKYYVYIKIDDNLIAEDYVAASVVDGSGNYTSNPGSAACNVTSGEIFFAFWGSNGNSIAAYSEDEVIPHDGIRGDLDGNSVIGSGDYSALIKVLLGSEDISGKPAGIADFNNDDTEDICDIIAVKKHIAPANTYVKPGDLTLGTQEHLLEKNSSGFTDKTKTAAYIADASDTLGAGVYRLSAPPGMIYKAKNADNELRIYNNTNLYNLKSQVSALKAKGINDILLVADSFILPYGYEDSTIRHGITVPNPQTEPEEYQAWLQINALAFATVAREVPEIKYFEPFNEINLTTTRLEKSGCAWNSTAEEQAAYKYTVKEKARIMADLCWYVSKAVKSVDPANQVTTPSVCIGSHASTIEEPFLNALYNAIESGNYPAGQSLGDKRIDNYFTIVNLHNYPEYVEDGTQQTKVNNAANEINSAYAVMQAHKDGGSRVWITETGVSSVHGNDTDRDLEAGANLMGLYLNKVNSDLTFIDTVILYKIADISSDNGMTGSERGFGLFYSGDDLDYPYAAKPIAKTVYSFFHSGSTDYSALDALVARYAG